MSERWTSNLLAGLWVVFGAVARLIPHPPNFTPTTAMCLFAGAKMKPMHAMITLAAVMLISDFFLGQIHNVGMFGWWSAFTYTGFIFVYFLGTKMNFSLKSPSILGITLSASTAFWLWTNLGVWLTSGMYAKSVAGLMACYAAAVPFLQTALIGDLVWMGVFVLGYKGSEALVNKYQPTASQN